MWLFSDTDQIWFPKITVKPEQGKKKQEESRECVVPMPNGMIPACHAWQKATPHSSYKLLIECCFTTRGSVFSISAPEWAAFVTIKQIWS